MALSRALTAQLKKYNTLLYPAKLAYRSDRDKYFFVCRRDGRDIRKVLSDDIHIAFERAQALRDEITKLPTGGALGITLGQWHERWSKEHFKKLSPTTADGYGYYWAAISDKLKNEELATISRSQIENELGYIEKTSMREHAAVLINTLLNAAVRADMLDKSPWQASFKTNKKSIPIYTPDELGLIFSHASKNSRIGLALAGFCGLRRGEIMGLKYGDIDLNRGMLHIHGTRVRTSKGIITKNTKTNKNRVIPIPDPVIPFLLERMKKKKRTEYIYKNYTDKLHERLRVACRRAELEPITLHELRHVCGSNIMMHGGPTLAQAILGHTSIKTTVDVYGHLNAPWLKRQMDMIHISGNFYEETTRLAEKIITISPDKIIEDEREKIMEVLTNAKKLANFTMQLCHQLTPNNKKGLT